MPKRPIQHIIGEKAEQCLRMALPEKWVISPLSPDYSKDFFAEVVDDNGELQGTHFLIQLKGTNSLKASGSDVVAPIDVEHVHYFQHRVQLPVMIALADVSTGIVYYEFVQSSLASGNQQRRRNAAKRRLKTPGRSRKTRKKEVMQFRIPPSQQVSMHSKLAESLADAVHR